MGNTHLLPVHIKLLLHSRLYAHCTESSLQALILVGFSASIEVTMCHQLIHRGIMIDTVIM